MGWRLDKSKAELLDAKEQIRAELSEIVIDNRYRYSDIKEWPSLLIDIVAAVFGSASAILGAKYTWAHIAVVGLSVYWLIF